MKIVCGFLFSTQPSCPLADLSNSQRALKPCIEVCSNDHSYNRNFLVRLYKLLSVMNIFGVFIGVLIPVHELKKTRQSNVNICELMVQILNILSPCLISSFYNY